MENRIEKPILFYKTLLCRRWQYLGYCSAGDSCNFAHGHCEIKYGHKATAPPICNFFGTMRGCNKGDKCPFQHMNLDVTYSDSFDIDAQQRVERLNDNINQLKTRLESLENEKDKEIAAVKEENRLLVEENTSLEQTSKSVKDLLGKISHTNMLLNEENIRMNEIIHYLEIELDLLKNQYFGDERKRKRTFKEAN